MTGSPHILGAFRLLDADDSAGKGGQGTVRRAVCERTGFPGLAVGTTVALKVMSVSDPDGASWQKLESMISVLASLDSPNVVRHYGCFRERAGDVVLHVVVMEFLEGETLRARLAKCPSGLGADVALEIVRAAASGLAAAAAAGVVHRDIKPNNVFLCADGKVKVIDFGIARHEDSPAEGVVPGTLDYMPPETITGDSQGSPASDVYSLGLCLYEALTGRPAFPKFKRGSSDSIQAFVVRARQMRAPELDAPLVAANPDLASVLRRMTDPDVAHRMSSAAEVELELQDLLDALARGEWHLPPQERTVGDWNEGDAPTADGGVQVDAPPVSILRRVVRNRRELMLVLALVIELLSTAVIIWQRPKPSALEEERRQLAERLKVAEKAREKAERVAAEALRMKAEGKGEAR